MNMRKIIFLLLLTSFVTISCDKQEEVIAPFMPTKTSNPEVNLDSLLKKPHLRVLSIGNSYTHNCTRMLPLLATALGCDTMDVEHCVLRLGGSSFKMWYETYWGNGYNGTVSYRVLGNLDRDTYYSSNHPTNGSGMRSILSQEWDIILIQPVSSYANDYSLWNTHEAGGYLQEYIQLLSNLQPNATFGMMLVHSYASQYTNNTEKSSSKRHQNISEAINHVLKDYHIFKLVIPYGEAIQQLRSYYPDNEMELTTDYTHLGLGLAEYTAACCMWEMLYAPRTGKHCTDSQLHYNIYKGDLVNIVNSSGCIDVTNETAPFAHRNAYEVATEWKKRLNYGSED